MESSDEDSDLERDPVSPSIDLKKDIDTITKEIPAFRIQPQKAEEGHSTEGQDAADLVLQDNQHYLNEKHGRPLRADETLVES